MLDRSPLIVEMDAMNSFKVDLLPSAMLEFIVDLARDLFMWCRSGVSVQMWSLCYCSRLASLPMLS